MGERITIDTPAGSFAAYLARPAAAKAPAIAVMQEIFGINADMRETCDRLASEGFIAACVGAARCGGSVLRIGELPLDLGDMAQVLRGLGLAGGERGPQGFGLGDGARLGFLEFGELLLQLGIAARFLPHARGLCAEGLELFVAGRDDLRLVLEIGRQLGGLGLCGAKVRLERLDAGGVGLRKRLGFLDHGAGVGRALLHALFGGTKGRGALGERFFHLRALAIGLQ